ncbi:ABC transporter permease [Aestuariibacter salexigens]|uniref:ABC transporter permease n=1 Tax=Aestuariibacter salexigens TaxID=226010 RepID=UPI000424BD76|nr:ABC transporter permease [Aestuariibacter salexigens]
MTSNQFFQLTITKVFLNLKAEASKSYLSYLWWVLEPALFVAVFYLVFGVFLGNRSEGFIVFLMCGKIPYLWFSRSVNNSANAIVAGGGLMNQVSIPKVFFPSVVVLQDLIKSAVVFLLMIVLVLINNYKPSIEWIAVPLLFLIQALVIAPIAIISSALVPFIPDLKFIVMTMTTMGMFASGIFYDYRKVVLPEHHDAFLLNPLANLIAMYRGALLENQWPDWQSLGNITGIAIIALIMSIKITQFFDLKYPRLVIR